MTSLFPAGSRRRSAVLTAALVGVVLLYTQVLLPGSPGSQHRGTPLALLFSGALGGLVNALTAVALVLIYRTQRVINFAQTALGVTGATLVFSAVQLTAIPFFVLLPAGLLLGALAGVVFDLLLRRFQSAPRLVPMVFTIAAAQALAIVGPSLVNQLPFIPSERASFEQTFGTAPIRGLLPFAGFRFRVGGFNSPFGFPEVFAIELSIVLLLLVAAVFRFTRVGVAIRALAENTERAALLGIAVGGVTMTAWAMAGVLGAAGSILTGSLTTPGSAAGIVPAVLLPALAAATLARFRSFGVAVLAAIVIQVVIESTKFSLPDDASLLTLALFVVIGGAFLLQRRSESRSEQSGGVSWQASEEPRPVPKELSGITGVRVGRYVLGTLGLAVVAVFPFVASTGDVVLGSGIALSAILTLSLVVLTGWAGQVSLGQYGFYAVGAVAGGSLASRVGLPFWLVVPLAAVVTGAFAALIGLPALRLRGLFLAVTTFAFSFAVAAVLFTPRYFGWLLPRDVQRPTLFLLDFDDERSMYFLCLAGLVLCIAVVGNLRRSRFGRLLIAVRENEPNVQSFGISVTRMKLASFAVSGALCGFAGALFAYLQRGVTADAFTADNSVGLFVFAVLGGVSSAGGAILGSLFVNLQARFFTGNILVQALGPFAALGSLYFLPSGLIGLVNRVRDEILRIVAQRRQIVVPSLFADYDPDALARRLIPLAEESAVDGLGAIAGAERYALASELYQGRGQRFIEKLSPERQTREAAAITAAVAAGDPGEQPGAAGKEAP